jgi:hypothetical protein
MKGREDSISRHECNCKALHSRSSSDVAASVYSSAWRSDVKISFSVWNIGEVLGVLDKYYRRGWLTREDFELTQREFIGGTLRMLRLRILRVVPVKSSIIVKSWRLIEKYHVY